MESLTLIVTYTMKPGGAEGFLQAVEASGVLEQIRGEDGCRRYEYFLPAQGGDTVLLIETWDSARQQQVHLKQPHMKRLKEIKERFALETQAEFLTEKTPD